MADIVGPVVFAGVGGEPEKGNTTMKEHNALRKAERDADKGEKCLYERFGGHDVMLKLVSGVYDRMRTDADVGPTFNKFASTEGTFQRLKDKTVEYLAGEWGGTPYDGPDLYISHSTFGIPVKMFDGMMCMFRDVLHELDVQEPEFDECMKSVTKMKGPMCDPGGTFAKEFNDYMEKMTKDREDRIKYYKKHNIPYSKMTGWALDPENDPYSKKAKGKATAKAKPTPVLGSDSMKLTMKEIADHNSAQSLWIVVDKKIYDATNYLKDHPGGPAILKSVGGQDGTKEFYAAHKPSKPNVKSVLKRLIIGSIEEKVASKKTVKAAPAKKEKADVQKSEAGASKQISEETASTACSSSFEPELDGPPAELPTLAKCALLYNYSSC